MLRTFIAARTMTNLERSPTHRQAPSDTQDCWSVEATTRGHPRSLAELRGAVCVHPIHTTQSRQPSPVHGRNGPGTVGQAERIGSHGSTRNHLQRPHEPPVKGSARGPLKHPPGV